MYQAFFLSSLMSASRDCDWISVCLQVLFSFVGVTIEECMREVGDGVGEGGAAAQAFRAWQELDC